MPDVTWRMRPIVAGADAVWTAETGARAGARDIAAYATVVRRSDGVEWRLDIDRGRGPMLASEGVEDDVDAAKAAAVRRIAEWLRDLAGYFVLLAAPADHAAAGQWFRRGEADSLADAEDGFRRMVEIDLADDAPVGFEWRLQRMQDGIGETLLHLRRARAGLDDVGRSVQSREGCMR